MTFRHKSRYKFLHDIEKASISYSQLISATTHGYSEPPRLDGGYGPEN